MKLIIHFILFVLCAFSVQADEGKSFHNEAAHLEKLLDQYQKLCIGTNGKVLTGTVIVDRKTIKSNGVVINCEDEARRLSAIIKEHEKKIKIYEAKDAQCRAEASKEVLDPETKQDITALQEVALFEGGQCKTQSKGECAKDIACNVLRTSKTLLLTATLVPESYRPPTCLNIKETSCLTELINGVIRDVWFNVEGAWDLAKMAAKAARKRLSSAWDYLTGVEDETSDAALAASKQSPGLIAQFKQDPPGFMKALAIEIWEDMGKSIKSNFGCERWSGVPHFSTCEKEMSSWECASCNQKMNAICGVGGVLGGEVLTAYLTGGVFSVGAKAGVSAGSKFAQAAGVVGKHIPKMIKIQTAAKATIKVVTTPFTLGLKLAKKVVQSKTALAIKEFAVKGKGVVLKAASKAPLQISLKVVKGAVSPVAAYLKLLDQSFALGMRHGDKLVSKTQKGFSKLSQVLARQEKLADVDELIIHTSQMEDISQEVLRGKLDKLGIEYEKVILKDGSMATRVKPRPECSKAGRTSYLFK